MTKQFDIIIVGGGIVGLALANLLAKQTSLSIALLETRSEIDTWDESTYHHRVSAISLASERLFKALGVWQQIEKKRISPFMQIEVWDRALDSHIAFDSAEIAKPILGYIIENNLMQMVLKENVRRYPHITFLSQQTLVAVKEEEHHIVLETKEGGYFTTSLAVAADGANSCLRALLKFDVDKYDYEQEAIVATVNTALPHRCVARQVFLETGPLAFLPLNDANTSSIVWSVPNVLAKELLEMDEANFKETLARAFSNRLGDVSSVGERFAFQLRKQQVCKYIKPRIALVGDAAHTIHPLAGQGVNMGLLDAASLAEVIADAVLSRKHHASFATLRRYERWRKADNLPMMQGVDFIKHLFASEKTSIKYLRSVGLTAVDRLSWIKNIFIRHAVGDRGDLPRILS